MFINDPDQKESALLLFKSIIAFIVFFVFAVLSGMLSMIIVSEKMENSEVLYLSFFEALPIGFFLTFLVYAFLCFFMIEEMFARYRLTFFLLFIKAFTIAQGITLFF